MLYTSNALDLTAFYFLSLTFILYIGGFFPAHKYDCHMYAVPMEA